MPTELPAESKPRRRCPSCGAELRFSHREYAGKGASAAVLRCTGCGEVIRDSARYTVQAPQRHTSKRHRELDAGPPENPVIDPELAAKLLRASRDSS